MVWIDDSIFYAMGGGKGKGGKGKGGGKGGWFPDQQDVWMAAQVMNAIGMGGGGYGGKGGGGKGGKSGKAKQAGAKAAGGLKKLQADLPWKSRLAHAYGKEHKTPPTKDSIVYTALPADDGGYMCTITCDKFAMEYTSEEVCPCKKLAEESAAMEALKAEFPSTYAAVPGSMKKKGALGGAGAERANQAVIDKAAGVPQKRKLGEPPAGPQDAKSRVCNGMVILAGRTLQKADLEYVIEEVNGNAVATLTLHCFEDKTPTFKGKAAAGLTKESKKQAEQNAAEKCLQEYAKQIKEALPVHQAKKDAKRAEFEAKIEAKKKAAEADALS